MTSRSRYLLGRQTRLLLGLWLLTILCPAQDPAPTPNSKCSAPEFRQFDFWVGEWDIAAKKRPPGTDDWTENPIWIRTRVSAALSGCAIIEESIDRVNGREVMVGKSISAYNRHLRKWQQTWVDQNGNVFEYVGGTENGEMVLNLEHRTGDGQKLVPFQPSTKIRMVFKNIEPQRLE